MFKIMSRRAFIAASAAGVAAGPALLGSRQAWGARPLPKVILGVSAPAAWSLNLPIYVAKDKGFFREEGISEFDLKMAGGQIIPAMLGRSVDIGHDASTYDVLRANARGEAIFIVGGYFKDMIFHFIVARDIKRVEDLKGKVVGIDAPGSPRDQYVRKALRSVGLDPDKDVRILPSGVSPERYRALVANRIQASVIAFDAANLYAQGFKALIDLKRVFPGEYPVEVMAATGSYLEKNTDVVVAYLKSMIKTFRFVKEKKNRDECLEIGTRNGLKNQEYAAAQYDLFTQAYPDDSEITLVGIQRIADELKAAGQLPESYQPRDALRLEPLQRARKELAPAKGS